MKYQLILELPISADLLRIVLRNLINNAIKYSHDKGTITLKYDKRSKELLVQDSGVGIPESQKEKLFKAPVYSNDGTAEETGLGIGLYITSELLSRVSWSIRVVESLKGTTFAIKPL